jgi:hypothetical protein
VARGGGPDAPAQQAEVMRGFAQSGLPLYLKLAFEEARRWPSYAEPESIAKES